MTKSFRWKLTNTRIVGILIIYVFLIILCGGCSNKRLKSSLLDEVQNATKRSASYLVRATETNGMFKYRVNMNPNIKVKRKYNILRHAGTIYAMVMYYQKYPDEDMRLAIERAGKYLKDKFILPILGQENMMAVWSIPEVNGSDEPLQAKLGGAGLGLLALISIENIHPGFTPLHDLQALGRFIVYMQKEDGSFYSKHIPSLEGLQDEWQSLYYPGEAALGLLMLYEKDPSDVWLESAAKALEYLACSRKNSTNTPADHWALLATEKILSFKNRHELPVSTELLINHAVQISNDILQSQVKNHKQHLYDGGFSEDGRTTPTATRLEGLLATLPLLPHNDEMRNRIDASVHRGIIFLLRAQVRKGKFVGAFPRAVDKMDQDIQNPDKFNRRATEVRIDYVQHSLSAMIQYLNLMRDLQYPENLSTDF